MSLIQIDHHPSRRQLGLFGACWLVFFGIIAAIVSGRTDSSIATAVMGSVAVVVPAVGWIRPAVMRIAYLGMAYATFPIGLIVSHVILLVVYYLVVTPIGLLMRLLGHNPMGRGFDADVDTYWVAREADDGLERYFRQF